MQISHIKLFFPYITKTYRNILQQARASKWVGILVRVLDRECPKSCIAEGIRGTSHMLFRDGWSKWIRLDHGGHLLMLLLLLLLLDHGRHLHRRWCRNVV
jgi:hypothetical protein